MMEALKSPSLLLRFFNVILSVVSKFRLIIVLSIALKLSKKLHQELNFFPILAS